MRLLVQHPGDVTVTIIEEVDADRPLVELIEVDEDELVWIGDSDEPVDVHRTLIEIGVEADRPHVHGHKHRCRTIHVKVTYAGHTKEHDFGPNSTLETLLHWAVEAFGIDATTAVDLVFRVAGSTGELDFSTHVGTLTMHEHCKVDLSLLQGDTSAG
jgi:hypothetical protein